VDGLAGVAIPDDGGLALVGDPDGGDIGRADIRLREHLGCDSGLSGPDIARVVLDPAGLWENLRKFFLRDGDDRAGVIEHDRAGAGRALVESENVFHAFQVSW
jgi:hypothetical protein